MKVVTAIIVSLIAFRYAFKKMNYKDTPLAKAIKKKASPEIIASLIQAGANVNAEDGMGKTSLMLAAMRTAHPEIINLLIRAGAKVNAKNDEGNTPLMSAVACNANPEIITILINAGADVNLKDETDCTAFDHLSHRHRKTQAYQILKDRTYR